MRSCRTPKQPGPCVTCPEGKCNLVSDFNVVTLQSSLGWSATRALKFLKREGTNLHPEAAHAVDRKSNQKQGQEEPLGDGEIICTRRPPQKDAPTKAAGRPSKRRATRSPESKRTTRKQRTDRRTVEPPSAGGSGVSVTGLEVDPLN